MNPMLPLHSVATGQYGEDTGELFPPVGGGGPGNFHILVAKWCILRPFSFWGAYLSLLKVLRY